MNIDTPTHYENNFIRIKYIEEKGIIEEVWKEFGEDDAIRVAKNKLKELLKLTGINGYLADTKGFKGASPENQLWVRDVWIPAAYKVGLRKIAIVFLEDVFGSFSIDTAINGEYVTRVDLQKFLTYEEAEEWIKE